MLKNNRHQRTCLKGITNPWLKPKGLQILSGAANPDRQEEDRKSGKADTKTVLDKLGIK